MFYNSLQTWLFISKAPYIGHLLPHPPVNSKWLNSGLRHWSSKLIDINFIQISLLFSLAGFFLFFLVWGTSGGTHHSVSGITPGKAQLQDRHLISCTISLALCSICYIPFPSPFFLWFWWPKLHTLVVVCVEDEHVLAVSMHTLSCGVLSGEGETDF